MSATARPGSFIVRVTGGRLGGRRLRVPRGDRVRPTADRVRESMFARLDGLEGARVLDAFAGTGALGIEALSRGAGHAVFVERAKPALAVLTENLRTLELASESRVVRGDTRGALRRLGRTKERFDWIFLDPPYGDETLPEVLSLSAAVLAEGGSILVESDRRTPLPEPPGLAILDARPYGDTLVTRLSRSGSQGAEAPAGAPSP